MSVRARGKLLRVCRQGDLCPAARGGEPTWEIIQNAPTPSFLCKNLAQSGHYGLRSRSVEQQVPVPVGNGKHVDATDSRDNDEWHRHLQAATEAVVQSNCQIQAVAPCVGASRTGHLHSCRGR